VSTVRYELGFCIPENDILHSHRRGSLKSYTTEIQFSKFSNRISVNITCMRVAIEGV
jgi:hypothetical protein